MHNHIYQSLLVSIISLTILVGAMLAPNSAFGALERQPYLQSVSDTRLVIRWRTTAATTSRVSYGPAVGNLNVQVDDNNLNDEHEVVITGLTANTRYFYSVGATNGTIEAGNDADHYFTTAPSVGANRKVRIWAIGDPGTGTSNQRNVRNAYYNLDNAETDVVLTLGDNAYNDGTDNQYTNNFFNVYQNLLRQAPVWATRGNHERNLNAHETAFTHPTNAESGGIASGSELYYSFDYGNIHFVCLDSFTSSNLNGDAMYNWLENDLASTTQKWIIAFWHHPPYSRSSAHDSNSEVGQRRTRERANPILERYGVDLQLGGHNHFYSRTVLINNHYGLSGSYSAANHAIDAGDGRENGDGVYQKADNPEGAVYVLAGSSGKIGYTPIRHPANFTEVVVLGSMVIDVDGDRMDVRMLRDTGAIQDSFTITKAPSVNQAPLVDAGADQTTDTVSAISLDATVTDDGLPGGALTYSWSKLSGPGSVNFGNANLVDTTASFSTVGSYVLQLAASDGELGGNNSLTVTVLDATNQAPQADAGLDQTVDEGTAAALDGSGSRDLDGTITAYQWRQLSGPSVVLTGADQANASFTAPPVDADTVLGFELTVTDNQGATDVDTVDVTVRDTTVGSGADLVVDALSTTQTALQPGDTLSFTLRTVNQGDQASTVTWTRLVLSTDALIDATDLKLRGVKVPALAGGAFSEKTREVVIPADLAPGTYYIGAIADFTQRVTETNEGNNALSGPQIVLQNTLNGPDLIVSDLSAASVTLQAGDRLSITVRTLNRGTQRSRSSWTRLVLSTDAVIDDTDLKLRGISVPALASGASSEKTRRVRIPANVAPGTYFLGAIADFPQRVTEADEGNNVLQGPPLTVE